MSSRVTSWLDTFVDFLHAWPVGIAASALVGSMATLGVVVIKKRREAQILSEMQTKSALVVRKNFWQREELEHFLAKSLVTNRKCICVTAPPRAGRTSLVHKALAENWKYEITMIDLRKSPFEDLAGFEERLAATQTSFHLAYGVARSVASLIRTGDLEDALGNSEERRKVNLNEFKASLKRIEAGFPKHEPHLIFLDNAELYRSLVKDAAGIRALQIFLEWAITLTKTNNITVVFACSTDFCYDWLLLPSFLDDMEIVFIGDLSKEDAYRYYASKVDEIVPEHLRSLLPSADEIYSVLGGRMHDIDQFIHLFTYSNGKARPSDSVSRIMTLLQRAFNPTEFNPHLQNMQGSPAWTSSQAYTVFKLIAESPYGCVAYWKIHELIGFRACQSLIKFGFIIYRPQCAIAQDSDDLRTIDTICMRRPIELFALRRLLKELNPDLLPKPITSSSQVPQCQQSQNAVSPSDDNDSDS